jgi:phage shock protein PspC (stress-responsive transcriptional regulator)
MAELLAEHGVTGEKVILPEDVEFLKAQLGDPKDFSDDDDSEAAASQKEPGDKRFFRDTDNAIVGGVAAGIANYFNIDAVIVRIALIALTFFSGGLVIAIYFILWWTVPPATTASEKLQMRGLPVTLEGLKEAVSNADIAGKAKRVNSGIASLINTAFRAVFKLAGVGFIAGGTAIILAVITTQTYMQAHGGKLFQENLFPVSFEEHVLTTIALGLLILIALFLVLVGITIFKRKWPIRAWMTAVLVGLFLVGTATAGALVPDAVTRTHQRYESTVHVTAVKNVQPFTSVDSTGSVDFEEISSPNYAINIRYVGNPDLSKLKISVQNGVLHVDSTQLDAASHCIMLCLFPGYDMTVQVFAPNIQGFKTPPHTDIFYPNVPALPSQD